MPRSKPKTDNPNLDPNPKLMSIFDFRDDKSGVDHDACDQNFTFAKALEDAGQEYQWYIPISGSDVRQIKLSDLQSKLRKIEETASTLGYEDVQISINFEEDYDYYCNCSSSSSVSVGLVPMKYETKEQVAKRIENEEKRLKKQAESRLKSAAKAKAKKEAAKKKKEEQERQKYLELKKKFEGK